MEGSAVSSRFVWNRVGRGGWKGRRALIKAKSGAAWLATSRRQRSVKAGRIHVGLLPQGSPQDRAQAWGSRFRAVPTRCVPARAAGSPGLPAPRAPRRVPASPASARLPLLLLPGAARRGPAGGRRERGRGGGALRRPGSSAGPRRVGAAARRCEARGGGRGGEQAGRRHAGVAEPAVAVQRSSAPHPSSRTRRASSWPGGKWEGCRRASVEPSPPPFSPWSSQGSGKSSGRAQRKGGQERPCPR